MFQALGSLLNPIQTISSSLGTLASNIGATGVKSRYEAFVDHWDHITAYFRNKGNESIEF
jgi:hypothetical protein